MSRTITPLPSIFYMGIDPGNDGGLGLVGPEGEALLYCSMPDIAGIDQFFRQASHLARRNLRCIFEEHKGGGPTTSASAHRSAGKYKAMFEVFCYIYNVPMVCISPQTWKKHLDLIIKQPRGQARLPQDQKRKLAKASSIGIAKDIFPGINLFRTPQCKNEHDGIAEGVLIAECGRRNRL